RGSRWPAASRRRRSAGRAKPPRSSPRSVSDTTGIARSLCSVRSTSRRASRRRSSARSPDGASGRRSVAGYRGRFAPSPTGELHLGSAATALVTWLAARSAGGALVLRCEDIDRPRVVPGALERQLDDLRWLGLDWDEGPDLGGPHPPYRQSERSDRYAAALAALAERGLLYYCDCSRAEVARAASAPHPGEEGPRYPGTCRRFGLERRPWRRPPALRLAVPEGTTISFVDRFQGSSVQDVS